MELRHLRYFTAVADTLNFHRAAEILHVAQPALSSQIKSLEEELNVQLFIRNTRSVNLTHAGRVFLEEARIVLSAANQAEKRARHADQGLVGTLRVGIIAPTANAWLAKILRCFHQKFPGVQLSLFDLTSTEQLHRLRAGELDAGLLRPPVGFAELDSMHVEESSQLLAMPTGHRLSRKEKLTWLTLTARARDDGPAGAARVLRFIPRRVRQSGCHATSSTVCSRHPDQDVAHLRRLRRRPHHSDPGPGQTPRLIFRPLPKGLPKVQTVLVWRKQDESPILANFRGCFKELAAES
ncbi:LysR family transcriptional regulator [Verrucomicrobium spinosum]|uniref:LysR family transcriptional regulator n=1 Tax=Verrucomicrobium spinosum TaxID=2736 RepID=UPI00210CB8D6|nr:LysR substrate-binding domain-containing protein [Verrucomicrobium spinosum]